MIREMVDRGFSRYYLGYFQALTTILLGRSPILRCCNVPCLPFVEPSLRAEDRYGIDRLVAAVYRYVPFTNKRAES